jgi:hypothetical protein
MCNKHDILGRVTFGTPHTIHLRPVIALTLHTRAILCAVIKNSFASRLILFLYHTL